MKKMLSAIKPTGQLTLGNYLGALKNFVKYQDDYDVYFFIANLHCITTYQEPNVLSKNLKDACALYLACGLDPNKITMFLQTDVKAHGQLGFEIACNTYMGELNRMTQFKDKVLKNEQNLTAGLYTYPCLMAADILLYQSDFVPVGQDQVQHVELTRDIAIRINNKYNKQIFKVPEYILAKTGKKIMSLQDPNKKMSKSDTGDDKGCIYLLDDLKLIRKKIMSAVTDSYNEITLDKEKQPGLYNLMEIASAILDRNIEDIANEFKGQGYGNFKKYIADVVCNEIEKIQIRYNEIINSDILVKTLKDGAIKANEVANKTLEHFEEIIGLKF